MYMKWPKSVNMIKKMKWNMCLNLFPSLIHSESKTNQCLIKMPLKEKKRILGNFDK